MPNIEADALLRTRRSTPLVDLGEPGPDEAALAALLTTALRVPDHSRLTPWRIQVVRGAARAALSDKFAAAYIAETAAPEAGRTSKLQAMPLAAPVLLVISSRLVRGHKVPEMEQLLSGGALCENILLAAHANGFGAIWLTGFAAYSPLVKQALDIDADQHILGFISLGTAKREPVERSRPVLGDIVSEWRGG